MRIIKRMIQANFLKYISFEYIIYLTRRIKPVINFRFSKKKIITEKNSKPVFLLGNQGGGLTIISRILRRIPNVVSSTGNSNYWSGADEMNSVFGSLLPNELVSIEHRKDLPKEIKIGNDWICGTNKYIDMDYSFRERLILACESWLNYVNAFNTDTKGYKNAFIIRLEDILENIEDEMENICNIIDLQYDKKILPSNNDKIPYGSRRKSRWYPVNSNVNKKYLEMIDEESAKLIHSMIGNEAKKYGYYPPIKIMSTKEKESLKSTGKTS